MSAARTRGRVGAAGAAGMTLVEAVVTIAVLAIAGVGAVGLIAIAARAQGLSVNLGDAVDAGTLASDLIALELREAETPPAVGLRGMSATELAFLDPAGNEVRYKISATSPGTLVRTENGGAERRVCDGVGAFQVKYRQDGGQAAAAAYEVRRVEFGLDLERGDQTRHFGGQVAPRRWNPITPGWREE